MKQTGNSTSAPFSHLKRHHYNVYVELTIQSRHSPVIGVNGEGHDLPRMPFRAAFIHHYRATDYVTRSLRPHATMLRDPDFIRHQVHNHRLRNSVQKELPTNVWLVSKQI